MNVKKIVNITHTDLDGVGCSVVLRALTEHPVESHFCGYYEIEDCLRSLLNNLDDSIETIYITDISFRKESGLVEWVNKVNLDKGYSFITLIDHHATSAYLNKYNWAISQERCHNTGELKCGTLQLYEYLLRNGYTNSSESISNFVRLVNLWDTWRWVADYPKEHPCDEANWLNMVFAMMGKQKFIDVYVKKLRDKLPIFERVERTLIECKLSEIEENLNKANRSLKVYDYIFTAKDQKFIRDYLKSVGVTDKSHLMNPHYCKHYKVGVVYENTNVSVIGNSLAKLHPELDFIALVSLPKTISFRCSKDLEVPLGIIANDITGKGGGHPNSAGGAINPKYINDVTLKLMSNLH